MLLRCERHNQPSNTSQIIVFALYKICKHQEYLERLRDEVSKMAEDEICGSRDHNTPLLDNFLKEAARLFPDQASQYILTQKLDLYL